MSTEANVAKKVLHDKIESQISTVQSTLEALKAKAQTAKANAELKTIADLLAQKHAIDQKLTALRGTSETAYDRAKADVESRVAELEKSVKAIERKVSVA